MSQAWQWRDQSLLSQLPACRMKKLEFIQASITYLPLECPHGVVHVAISAEPALVSIPLAKRCKMLHH